MALKLDIYDDGGLLLTEAIRSGSELAKVASSKVKSAVVVDKTSAKFIDAEFALLEKRAGKVVGRYYPIADLGNSVASYFYFTQTKDALPESIREDVEGRLIGAMRKHGADIPSDEDVEKTAAPVVDEHIASVRTKAPAPKDHILVKGQVIGVSSEEHLQKLAEYVGSNANALSPVEKREVALQLAARGITPPDSLAKYAALDENPSRGYLYGRRRKLLEIHRPDAIKMLDDIQAIEDLEKQAVLLNKLDREVSMHGIPDAFITVFGKVEVPPTPAKVSQDKLEKIASVMGNRVSTLVSLGKASSLSDEHRRVLAAIMEE